MARLVSCRRGLDFFSLMWPTLLSIGVLDALFSGDLSAAESSFQAIVGFNVIEQ